MEEFQKNKNNIYTYCEHPLYNPVYEEVYRYYDEYGGKNS